MQGSEGGREGGREAEPGEGEGFGEQGMEGGEGEHAPGGGGGEGAAAEEEELGLLPLEVFVVGKLGGTVDLKKREGREGGREGGRGEERVSMPRAMGVEKERRQRRSSLACCRWRYSWSESSAGRST